MVMTELPTDIYCELMNQLRIRAILRPARPNMDSLDAFSSHRESSANLVQAEMIASSANAVLESLRQLRELMPDAFVNRTDGTDIDHLFTRWLTETDKNEDIITILVLQGFGSTAARLRDLVGEIRDEADQEPIDIESLREFAWFLNAESKLHHPRISIDPDGFVHAEWRSNDIGILAMEFQADGKIQFTCILGKRDEIHLWERLSGTMQRQDMMDALTPAIRKLGLR